MRMTFSRMTVASLMASAATLAASPACAQEQEQEQQQTAENESDEGEIIIVTGLRGITRTIGQTKIDTDGVLDTLTNAEIELVSDFSLAEASSRISGVSSVPFNGQPRFLSLRGFDARYNSSDLDGNPIWNSSENNRGTQLDLIPSSAVNQIDVHKALTPDIDANSIGGHISIRTLRAFDGGTQPYFKGRAQYGVQEQGNGGANYRVDGVGKFTFGDSNNFGAVFGFDLQKRNLILDTFNLRDGLQIFTNAAGNDVEIPARGTWRFDRQNISEKNSSVFGKLEARSEDSFYGFLTVNYYEVKDEVEVDRRREFVDTRPDRVLDAEQGIGTAARGADEYQISDFTRDINTLLIASGVDYRVGDQSSIKARASWSRVRLEEDFFQSGRFSDFSRSGNRSPRTFDITGDFGIFDRDRTVGIDPANYVYRRATFEEDTDLNDDLYSARLDFDHNAHTDSLGFGFKAGVWWRRLDRLHDRTVRQASLNPGVNYTFADNRPGPVDFFDPAIGIDRSQLRSFLNANTTIASGDVGNLGADYRLQENVLAGYVMGIYATENFRAIGGLRVEDTDLTDNIFTVTDGIVTPDSFTTKYTNVLPYAHLVLSPQPNIRLRAAYTKTIGRPDFEAFAFGSQITTNGLSTTTTLGNRNLGPRKADNFDISAEYYFDDADGYVAVGAFYKKLKNEHFSQTSVVLNPADPLGQATFRTTTFSDNGEATVKGIEFSFVMKSFESIAEPLKGLGLIANYTYLDGEYNVVLDDGTTRTINSLRNQPRQLLNLTGLYNVGPATFSLAYNWTDEAFTGDFRSQPSNGNLPQLNDIFTGPFGTLDAKIAVEVTQNFTLTAAAKNLTNAVFARKTGLNRDLASQASRFGRSYYFGLKAKF